VGTAQPNNPYIMQACALVEKHVIEPILDKSDPEIPDYEIYVVWFSKTLGNWKAMVSTSLPDQMYYEVTHNGNHNLTYIDAYKKFRNVCVSDEGLVAD
jgi:hypothetical protein